jgi:hypothetical protein
VFLANETVGREERVPLKGLAAVSNILVQNVDILLAFNAGGGGFLPDPIKHDLIRIWGVTVVLKFF